MLLPFAGRLCHCLAGILCNLQDENGINRPVCSYVHILRAGRLLESPRRAARFVSLLAHEKAPMVGGGEKHEQWCTLLAFLCRGKVMLTFIASVKMKSSDQPRPS